MAVIQREYKDRLFQFIFGREENKAWTLSLYNAVNGTAYTNPNLVQINTIKEVLYLGMHNDTSFLLTDDMNLYEQQSSYNPNMPLRMMQYAGNLYEKYIKENGLNKYGSELLKLPVPRLIVFYNGVKDTADETMLRLSDSFPEGPRPDIEVSVRMININHEQNKDLLDEALSIVYNTIGKCTDSGDLDEEALTRAIKSDMKSFIYKKTKRHPVIIPIVLYV